MEDALKKLDKLTNEEARMATAEVLKATHTIDERVRDVSDRALSSVSSDNTLVAGVINGALIFSTTPKK